jgi:hypothetical protein
MGAGGSGMNTTSGLELINGKDIGGNETKVTPANLENGQPYTVNIRVIADEARAEITVALDGKPYIKWAGPQQALSPNSPWALRNSRCLGIGVGANAVFHSVRLRMLSGKALPKVSPEPGKGTRP